MASPGARFRVAKGMRAGLAAAVVLAGVAAIARQDRRVDPNPRVAEGTFWRVLSGKRGDIRMGAASGGLMLSPRNVFQLLPNELRGATIERVRLRLQRAGKQSSAVHVDFRDAGAGRYRALVVPGTMVTGQLSYVGPGGETETLAKAEVDGLLADPSLPFDLTVLLDGPNISFHLDDRELLAATDRRANGNGFAVRSDGGRLKQIDVTVAPAHGDGAGTTWTHRFDVDGRGWSWSWIDLALALGAMLATAGFLRALCAGRPTGRDLAKATLFALAPVSAPMAAASFLASGAFAALVALLAVAGLFAGLFSLRAHLHRSGTPRTLDRVRAALVFLLCGGGLVHSVAATRDALHAELDQPAKRAATGATMQPFRAPVRNRLDAGNAVVVPGRYRNFDLRGTLTPAEGTVLELRLRAPDKIAEGVALLASTDSRFGTRFFYESRSDFVPIGTGAGALATNRPHELLVRARGAAFEAWVDGVRVATAEERRFPAGRIVILTASGAATLDDLAIEPVAEEPEDGATAIDGYLRGTIPLGFVLALALVIALLLGRPLSRVVEPFAYAMIPPAIALLRWAEDARLPLPLFAWTAAASVLLLVGLPLGQGKTLGHLRLVLALLVSTAAGPALVHLAAGDPILVTDATDPELDGFAPPRIHAGFVHYQHPRARHLNRYLIDHRFRGRAFAAVKPSGTIRIVALGSSSTWGAGTEDGSGLDYPSVLERLLLERNPGTKIEVINAGVSGSYSSLLVPFLQEVLAGFAPDVVTVSLGFNDSGHLPQFDTERFLERVTSQSFTFDFLERVKARVEISSAARRHERELASFGSGDADLLAAWRARQPDPNARSPVERFASSLEAMARLGRDHGFSLVLIKEPTQLAPRNWLPLFHQAMESAGAARGIEVVDPGPALQGRGGAKLFMDAVHLVPQGHRVMAEILLPVVQAEIDRVRERDTAGR